jgi:hypothetical protein
MTASPRYQQLREQLARYGYTLNRDRLSYFLTPPHTQRPGGWPAEIIRVRTLDDVEEELRRIERANMQGWGP